MKLSDLEKAMQDQARKAGMSYPEWLDWMKKAGRNTNAPWEDKEDGNKY